ncbi:MAG: 3-deoxy-8-phosphooctulonate synthase [Lentisphaeria bacterium]|nr:3-deoxy-8-phosphooctulonate synthase [Lentisphaeria bacterium]
MPVGEGQPLAVFSGPCVIESLDLCLAIAEEMQGICARVGVGYVFKASFDKANRTSVSSFRGPGLEQGLKILQAVKDRLGCPVVTDLHMPEQAVPVAEVADILQIPAFLSRQTDLLLAAGETGRTVNIKKGQFLAPGDMAAAVAKVRTTGNQKIMVTERGTTFGYHNLVVDMRGLVEMASLGVPVVFDGTHSVQLPGGGGTVSGGQREYICPLVRGAVAVGVDALFLEVHPTPEKALCDGANSLPLAEVESLLQKVRALHELV